MRRFITFILILISATAFAQVDTIYWRHGVTDPLEDGTEAHPYDHPMDFCTGSGSPWYTPSNTYIKMMRGGKYVHSGYFEISNDNNTGIGAYGVGSDEPIIWTTGSRCNVEIRGTNSYIELDGIEFRMPSFNGIGNLNVTVLSNGDVNHLRFTNLVVKGGYNGIRGEAYLDPGGALNNIYIDNVDIDSISTDGIFFKGYKDKAPEVYPETNIDSIWILNSSVKNVQNKWKAVHNSTADGDCIHLLRVGWWMIDNCYLDRNNQTTYKAVYTFGGCATDDSPCVGTIQNSEFHGTYNDLGYSFNMIYLQQGTQRLNLYNNKFFGHTYPGKSIGGTFILRPDTLDVQGNVGDSISQLQFAASYTDWANMANNTFILHSGEDAVYQTGNANTYIRNNIHGIKESGALYDDGLNGGVNITQSNNLNMFSNDRNTFDATVNFVDMVNQDFHLTAASSAAIGQGASYAEQLSTDHDGNAFNSPQDIGAYQYIDAGGTIGTPTATSATNVTQTGFTANWGSVVGATSYQYDVSTVSNFATYVLDSVDVTGVTDNVTGLTANTTYYYRVRALGSEDTSSNSNTIQVTTLKNAPVADFVASDTEVQAGTSVDFTDLSTNSPTSWVWNFEGGITVGEAGTENPSVTYPNVGIFDVSLTATNNGGSDTETKVDYITVFDSIPVAAFTVSDDTILVNETIAFTDQSTNVPTSWRWTFNPSTITYTVGTSSSQNPTVQFTASGDYSISLTVTNDYGSDVLVKTDSIHVDNPAPPNPIPDAPIGLSNQNVDYTSYKGAWSASVNATYYLITVSSDSTFKGSELLAPQDFIYSNYNIGDVTEYTINDLTTNTSYWWYIRAGNEAGVSETSDTLKITTLELSIPTDGDLIKIDGKFLKQGNNFIKF